MKHDLQAIARETAQIATRFGASTRDAEEAILAALERATEELRKERLDILKRLDLAMHEEKGLRERVDKLRAENATTPSAMTKHDPEWSYDDGVFYRNGQAQPVRWILECLNQSTAPSVRQMSDEAKAFWNFWQEELAALTPSVQAGGVLPPLAEVFCNAVMNCFGNIRCNGSHPDLNVRGMLSELLAALVTRAVQGADTERGFDNKIEWVWWSWSTDRQKWCRSCWKGATKEEAIQKRLESRMAKELDDYTNVLVCETTSYACYSESELRAARKEQP